MFGSVKYPFYSQPSSGYEDFPDVKHVGILDYATWTDGDLSPSGQYHQIYKHHINNKFSANAVRANAASVELGVGRHIAEVARYANMNNLGRENARVGVGYFYEIGQSGSASWWTATSGVVNSLKVNDRLIVTTVDANNINVYSGYLTDDFTSIALNTSPTNTTSGFMYDSCFLDRMYGRDGTPWKFKYGSIITKRDLSFFDHNVEFGNDGSAKWIHPQDLYFTDRCRVKDLVLKSSATASGKFESFRSDAITEKDFITHFATVSGHSHQGTGWSELQTASPVIRSTYMEDGDYLYALSRRNIMKFDTTKASEPNGKPARWTGFRTRLGPLFNRNDRVAVNGNGLDYAVFGNAIQYEIDASGNTLPGRRSRGTMYGDRIVYYRANKRNIQDSFGSRFPVENRGDARTEAYKIGSESFFVMGGTRFIYRYDGGEIDEIEVLKESVIETSTIWNDEIFIVAEDGKLYRYNELRTIEMGTLPTNMGRARRIYGVDSVLYVEFRLNGVSSVHAFNVKDSLARMTSSPLLETTDNHGLSVYFNDYKVYVQIRKMRRSISRSLAASLNLDSIEGILKLGSGSINCTEDAMMGNIVVKGRATEPFEEDKNDVRMNDRKYLVVRRNEYIDDIPYNKNYSRTYTDITASTSFEDQVYYGHRGDVTVFDIDKSGNLSDPKSTEMQNKIVTRFMPAGEKLYCLVQDFTITKTNYTTSLPEQPFEENRNHIPNFITTWGTPSTKVMLKEKGTNAWYPVNDINVPYGDRIIDATTHDAYLYVLAHTPYGSGVICNKYDTSDVEYQEIETGYSGAVDLKENLLLPSEKGSQVYDFVTRQDGAFVVDTDGAYVVKERTDTYNGYNRFFLYNHPRGVYVAHDRVDRLFEKLGAGGVTGTGPTIDTEGIRKYNYRVIDLSFVDDRSKESDITNSAHVIWSAGNLSYRVDGETRQTISAPFARIVVGKDNYRTINNIETNTYEMARLAQFSNRRYIRFITSVVVNEHVFVIMQTGPTILTVFRASNLYPYSDVTVGDSLGRVALNGKYDAFVDNRNHIYTRFNITKALGPPYVPVRVLGDSDDMFIQDADEANYRLFKRYASSDAVKIGNDLHVPILCRRDNPSGEMLTMVMTFFGDGTVKLARNSKLVELMRNPVGRTRMTQHKDEVIISGLKLRGSEKSIVSFEDIKSDPIYDEIFEGVNVEEISANDRFNRIYNVFGKKRWRMGRRKMRIKDIMNIRENI